MDHHHLVHFLGLLAIILVGAKIGGALAQRIGQPAVLGELLAGVVLGSSLLGLVDAKDEIITLLKEVGVIILLFEIGLETDLKKLLKVGGASVAVALAGVILPFSLGYAVCWAMELDYLVSLFVGAALTATSVGITARVLSDLGRLQDPEGQVILGAAILDDVIGLVILAVVTGMAGGAEVTALGVAQTTGIAFGFLVVTLLLGLWIVPWLDRILQVFRMPGSPTIIALVVALGLAWLADQVGSALIIGAFAAGLFQRELPMHEEIEKGVASLGHFFVPIFFVAVGAAVDVRTFNPLDPAAHPILLLGGLLVVAAIIGKFAAGFAPFWFKGNKAIIGVGMIPRGEVGLIFAGMGLSSGIFDRGLFSAVALMVMVTTFIAPVWLKWLAVPKKPQRSDSEGIEDLVAGPREED
ncbi:High-affinity Na(+)/H(+) antiporter NhaS3 [Anatilimnocola aggregata]|uniref:High-affinity Na(+)/H(+) antiporter NhaS3 n=1 Tax=Anatilimnocola aggregata TaxID=2528021 RepID=A0A517Y512_9BACT|nr:cation:proton antiporter [Anatilimnocola aggregata]QDU25334.1 High-affinity Na(+)/H(+) antiporter NhaS3 [Anatilimnocola aggregata]